MTKHFSRPQYIMSAVAWGIAIVGAGVCLLLKMVGVV